MKLLRKIRALFRQEKLDAEMAEEMRTHVELQAQANLAAGMPPIEARYAAQRQFGHVPQLQEQARAVRRWLWLEDLLKDVRQALRSLRRAPGFTAVAVLTLALGVGATTAIFSVVDAVVWRPLPFAQPERLVTVRSALAEDLPYWRDHLQSSAQWEAYAQQTMLLTGGPQPERLGVMAISPGLFSLLGRAPALGREFLPGDEQPGNAPVALISDAFWKNQFGGDPDVLGRPLVLDGQTYRIAGVMPAEFAFPRRGFSAWVPLALEVGPGGGRPPAHVDVISRLRDGVTVAAAQAELRLVNRQLDQARPGTSARNATLQGLNEFRINPGPRKAMLLFLGAIGFVLLIACVNVATLMLARSAARHRELTIRSALGAGRWRILRQLLTESLILTALGSAGGLVVGCWAAKLLWAFTPRDITFLVINKVGVDYRVVVFVCLLTGLSTMFSGLIPAWRTVLGISAQPMDDLTRTATAGPRHTRFLRTLVVTEVALSFVLLAGAGLMARSFVKLSEDSPGFEPANLLAMTLNLPRGPYPALDSQKLFFGRLQDSLRAMPEVAETALAAGVPPVNAGFYLEVQLEIEGREPQSLGGPETLLPFNNVAADYFRVMRIPLVRGRSFDAQDAAGATPAVIINQTLAGRFWPDGDPVGQRIRVSARLPWLTIVGVAGDVKAMGPGDPNGSYEIYTPLAQTSSLARTTVVIRTRTAPAALLEAVKRRVWAIDPALPVGEIDTVENLLAGTLATERFYLLLMGAFAGGAIALVAVGLYGVMAYSVALRTREMGVRLALGASPRALFKLVLQQGFSLAVAGVGIGLVAALSLTRLLKSLLFGVTPTDPLTMALIAIGVGAIALLACFIPARRATKVDPVVALRAE
jgi:putative ABC transport system permease protein